MSFRKTAVGAADKVIQSVNREIRANTRWLPVLHVEQLDTPAYKDATINFCRRYAETTGKKVMATVMTPLSPLVADRLHNTGVSINEYGDFIEQVGAHADIGLHGHFLRQHNWPQHTGFFDLGAIREQIILEVDFLRSRDLIGDTPLTYSAGWWFMVPAVQNLLLDLGFSLDFSLSVSNENFSVASHLAQKQTKFGDVVTVGEQDGALSGAFALASINRSDSQSFGLLKQKIHTWRGAHARYLTLYSHDYDLDVEAGIASVMKLADMGFSFFNAEELAAA